MANLPTTPESETNPDQASQKNRLITGPYSLERDDLVLHFGIGAFLCFLLMTGLNFYQDRPDVAAIDFSTTLILAGLLIHLKLTGHTRFFIAVATSLEFTLLLYFFITGGGSESGFAWSYALPLTMLALCGMRIGSYISILYLLLCLASIQYGLTGTMYDADFAIRFSLSYLVVTIIACLYEANLSRHQRKLAELNNSLEIKVAERTAELMQMVREKEKAHEKAEKAKKDWERTFNAVEDPLFILDEHFRILKANKAATEILSFKESDLIGMKCHKIVHDTEDPPPYCPYLRLKRDTIPCTNEFFEERLQRSFQVNVSPIYRKDGSFCGAVHIIRDITDQKKAEEARKQSKERLRKAEKMEAIGLMASGVAHDLNNILSGVVSYPDMLLAQIPEDDTMYQPLQAIHKTGKRAAAVVDDLLTVARGVATVKETHNLNTIILDYLGSVDFQNAQEKHPLVSVAVQLDEKDCPVVCSPIHIQKVLMNLIINGMEAIEETGRIEVTTTTHMLPATQNEKGYVTLIIKDSGTGISKENLQHIFEPFYTRKIPGRKGTGLGLAVVWNIIDDHEAVIDVESNPGGTTFNCCFKLSNTPETGVTDDIDVATLMGSGSILVVDDEPRQRQIATEMLAYLGYTVTTVSSGEACIDYCRANRVDLLLLDMIMDPGINGLQTYKKVLALHPVQKALITSGFSESSDVTLALRSGPSRFLRKPYSLGELGQAVKTTMEFQIFRPASGAE